MLKFILAAGITISSYEVLVANTLCKSQSHVRKTEYTVGLEAIESEPFITINGRKLKILAVVKSDFSTIADLIRCDIYDDPCHERYFASSLTNIWLQHPHVEVALMHSYAHDDEIKLQFNFDLNKIASGSRYFLSRPTKFASEGFAEFFDTAGRHLGYILTLPPEIMDCH